MAAEFAAQEQGQASPVRVDSNTRVGNVASRPAAGRSASTPAFFIDDGATASEARTAASISAPASVDALLALQSVEDPLSRRRKLVRRGTRMIDALEGLRAELLVGRISGDRLQELLAVLAEARNRSEPRLDSLIDDIELRVRVELAKYGHFPA